MPEALQNPENKIGHYQELSFSKQSLPREALKKPKLERSRRQGPKIMKGTLEKAAHLPTQLFKYENNLRLKKISLQFDLFNTCKKVQDKIIPSKLNQSIRIQLQINQSKQAKQRSTELSSQIRQKGQNLAFRIKSLDEQSTRVHSVSQQQLPFKPRIKAKLRTEVTNRYDTKQQQDNPVRSKLKRMFACHDIILSSYCLGSPQQSKESCKYYYFVGKGNNKNLVRSIMKKRWHWVQTDDCMLANFVWTQIKVSEVIRKQINFNDSGMDAPDCSAYFEQSPNTPKVTMASHKIFHPHFSKRYHESPPALGRQTALLREFCIPMTVHNHFESNYMLGNKNALYHNLLAYCNHRQKDVNDLVPLTIYIESLNSKQFQILEKKAKFLPKELWIIKPAENSNRGQGIFLAHSFPEIRKKLQHKTQQKYIIQRYITNLFLFNRRKFDIRTYLLMVNLAGVTKFYWYSEGYLRTSSQIYDVSDVDDIFVHLTNDAIQKNSSTYGRFEKGNKITYNEFQRYLDLNYPNEKYSFTKVVESMKATATEVARATYCSLDPHNKYYGFELFGMDFIIDSNFRPWLLEVNTNPCLELSSPPLERLIPRMMENLFRIAVDPVFRPNDTPKNAYYIYESSLESNRFEVIFDSLFDRDFEWQQKCRAEKKVYSDDDEFFENEGEMINTDF